MHPHHVKVVIHGGELITRLIIIIIIIMECQFIHLDSNDVRHMHVYKPASVQRDVVDV